MAHHEVGAGGGLEFPHGDEIQAIMVSVFLVVWAVDLASRFLFNYGTVLFGIVPLAALPVTLAVAVILIALGFYLIKKSFRPIFLEKHPRPTLIDVGVYGWVRHPMYLGGLLVLLGFFFVNLSVLAVIVWIVMFAVYDRMAAFEEKDLVRVLGNDYVEYLRRVPRWFPASLNRKTHTPPSNRTPFETAEKPE